MTNTDKNPWIALPSDRRLGGAQEGTTNELTVWQTLSGLAMLRVAGGAVLACLQPDGARRLAQLVRNAPETNTEIGGMLLRGSADLVELRDGQGDLVTCLGPRAAREIAGLLEQAVDGRTG